MITDYEYFSHNEIFSKKLLNKFIEGNINFNTEIETFPQVWFFWIFVFNYIIIQRKILRRS